MSSLNNKVASLLLITLTLASITAPAQAGSKDLSLKGFPADFRLQQPVGNVVVDVISKRISSLPQAKSSSGWRVSYITEKGVPKTYVDSIRTQVKYFSGAYSDLLGDHADVMVLYLNHDFAVKEFRKRNCYVPNNLLNKTAGSVGPSSESSNCNEDYRQGISALNVSSYAKFDPAPIRDPRYTDNWEYQVGQENGGTFLQTSLNSGTTHGDQNKKWWERQVALPAWYEQGGQFAMSSVALAVSTRKWRQSSLVGGNFYRGCAKISLKSEEFYGGDGCHYTGGSSATELMVALYGFDALVKWYENVGISTTTNKIDQEQNWADSFEATFGDSLEQFYLWADRYALYIDSGKPLPSELLARLGLIKG